MKRILAALSFSVVAVLGTGGAAFAKINVVATIPDLAELARRIGGDEVAVSSIATGVEDIHGIPLKPSFVVLLNRADLVVLMGLDVEHAFLPSLLETARNPKIARDAPGYIDCSTYVSVLDVPTRLDRSLGDQHPMGNPHYNLDPVAMKSAARAMEEGFERNYPERQDLFRKNLADIEAELDRNLERWLRDAAPLKGRKIVSYHPDFVYLAGRFGMQVFGTIEIRAGVDPTPGHVEDLIDRMKREHVDVVIRERQYPAGLAETVAERSGAKLVELPVMVGGVPEAKDYAGLIDYEIRSLVRAVEGVK